ENGCIKAKPADRLKRHFDSKIGRIAEIEKAPGLFPRLAIFGKIASGLAHHPDGRWKDRFTVDHSQDFALHLIFIRPVGYLIRFWSEVIQSGSHKERMIQESFDS